MSRNFGTNKKLGLLAVFSMLSFVVFMGSLMTEPKGCPASYHFLTDAAGYCWFGATFFLIVISAFRAFQND